MKVLLFEDVENLGWLGDIVTVRDGYARNYLVPQGLAGVPTEANIKALADEKARRAEKRKLQRQQQEELAESITGAEVVIAAKANELGHLFGSVAERDIADNLRQQGFVIKDGMVKLPAGHIKELGTHDISLKITADLTAPIRVVVVSQDQTVDAIEEETTSSEE
jgi:large subunit ribosomal protein L9